MVAGLVAPLVAEAAARGVPRRELLDTLGLSDQQLADPERRVGVDRVLAVWEQAMRSARDPGLPLAVARHTTIERLGVLGYALYTGRTARSALEALARYHDLINDSGRWRLTVTDDCCTVAWEREGPRLLGMRCANEQVLASFINLADSITPQPVRVQAVCFRHPAPAKTRAHETHFRGPLHWEASQDALLLDPALLKEVPRGFDAVTSGFFEDRLRAEREKAGPSGSWRHRVAGCVGAMLPEGLPTLDQVARELGTSGRTLRRRLAEEDAKYEAILTGLQRSRAEAMLEQGSPLRDIAFAVGYADLSAFSRAYKRWTGIAPSASRKR